MKTAIIGWSHGVFGRHDNETVESLIASVAAPAISDAGLQPGDIDAIWLGHFNSGLSDQDFGGTLVMNGLPGLRFKPATRVENACATGSAAVHSALDAIEAGRIQTALVIGVEHMTGRPRGTIGDILMHAAYLAEEATIEGGFAGVFGRITEDYFARYGNQSEALAMIGAKNHLNGVDNPYAQMRKDVGFAFCNTISDRNPRVVGPLRRTDCSLVSDGAAALVLASADVARGAKKAVRVRARAQIGDFLPMSRRDMTFLDGAARAWQQALDRAGMTLGDLSLVETHDCFTTAELMEYEAMGLTPRGEGARAIVEGWTAKDGRLPVNPSGGLKAKGHPIGATGVSMHVVAAMQIAGEAGAMQIAGASAAGIFNMGGAGVANYVSILDAS